VKKHRPAQDHRGATEGSCRYVKVGGGEGAFGVVQACPRSVWVGAAARAAIERSGPAVFCWCSFVSGGLPRRATWHLPYLQRNLLPGFAQARKRSLTALLSHRCPSGMDEIKTRSPSSEFNVASELEQHLRARASVSSYKLDEAYRCGNRICEAVTRFGCDHGATVLGGVALPNGGSG